MLWSLLILTLPSQGSTARMRAWRSLKALGAAVLRDGVYLLPEQAGAGPALQAIAEDVRQHGGQAHVLDCPGEQPGFVALFDRSAAWSALQNGLTEAAALLAADTPLAACERRVRALEEALQALAAQDFFPGEPQRQARATLAALQQQLQRRLQPGEPAEQADAALARLDRADYQGRRWATRARPWVDRLASAWLIRRFIDPAATLLWLARPADCPADALGYDFDGATFTHAHGLVSFEVLMLRFGLDADPALQRLGRLVHALDLGGTRPPEAEGVARVLAGMRQALTDDDQLAQVATGVFEGLLISFQNESRP